MRCIIAEKPSVALDIARALGTPQKHEGYVTVGADTITWAYGHLLTLANPEQYDPTWKRWDWATLPMLPERFQLTPIASSRAQLTVIQKLLKQAERVVVATDPDREGEAIWRRIAQWVGLAQPADRLWLAENTPAAIRDALTRLKPDAAYDALARAAEARAQADWLVGLNATRGFSLRHGESGQPLSVGRVQTPTLRIIVDRDTAIETFQSTPYWQVAVTFAAAAGTYVGVWQGPDPEHPDRIPDPATAAAVLAQVKPGTPGVIQSLERKVVTLQPPLLYSLNDVQKEANRRFGLTAQQTLDAAQALYDQHLTSYPRTDSRYITQDIAGTLADRLGGLMALDAYHDLLAAVPRPLIPGRLVNDTKVAAAGHYAVLPTGQVPSGALPEREQQVFDLIVRRLLAALMPAGQDERTTILTVAHDQPFKTTGTRIVVPGWRAVLQPVPDTDDIEENDETPPAIPAGLRLGDAVTVQEAGIAAKETKAPARLTDASLLALMEKHNLGTPATRARIVEVLLQRQYVERRKKAIQSTTKGQQLLTLVPETLQSPALTGQWEAQLEALAAGEEGAEAFLREICTYTRELVDAARGQTATPVAKTHDLGLCPVCHIGHMRATPKGWGCDRWREGCRFTIWKSVAGKTLTTAQVKTLLAGHTTGELKGFKSQSGKTFAAKLYLNLETQRVEFVFDDAPRVHAKTDRQAAGSR